MHRYMQWLPALLVLLGIVFAEADLQSERIPHIDVQSTFSESWEPKNGDALAQSSGHIIVINAGWKEPDSDLIVPMNGSESVFVQVQSQDLPILIANADGFQREMIVRKEPRLFTLNPAGRLSFTIPLVNENDGSFNFRLPELLIRHDDMEEDQW